MSENVHYAQDGLEPTLRTQICNLLIIDAVHAIETVGGTWLGMSAIAFILLALFLEIRKKSATIDVTPRHDGRVLNLAAKTEKRVTNKAPGRKAA